MSFNPAPAFPPPAAPARKSRAGGVILILAGIAAAVSPFIAWFPPLQEGGKNTTLKAFNTAIADAEKAGADFSNMGVANDPRYWFYAILGGAGIAVLFGLIGLAGGKGANVTAGIFGLIAAIAIAFPPVWLLTGADSVEDLSSGIGDLGIGYFTAGAAGFLALLGMLFAFIGAAKK
ncbi:MAG: hypothetical protein ACRD0P_13915 [Stackebrandtia sp.]